MNSSYSVIIPTLNAEKTIAPLLDVFFAQLIPPVKILVVDSASNDKTAAIAAEKGAEVIIIPREEYDHGKTRDFALRQTDTPFVIVITQDALPVGNDCTSLLLAPMLDDPDVAVVGGRQQAYPTARYAEKVVREYNYPNQSRVWSAEHITELGIRAYLISDVFAAYRISAYEAVGGFDYPILTNEDMLITQKFLEAGYKVAYSADAVVLHSHDFSLRQQFKRNYIVGQTMVRYKERFRNNEELGEGISLALYVLKRLLCAGKICECFSFSLDCAARLLGNRMGRAAEVKAQKRRGNT